MRARRVCWAPRESVWSCRPPCKPYWSVVRLMEAGQKVTLFPALADQAAMERMQALDELTREAYALGLYDRNVPAEPSPR